MSKVDGKELTPPESLYDLLYGEILSHSDETPPKEIFNGHEIISLPVALTFLVVISCHDDDGIRYDFLKKSLRSDYWLKLSNTRFSDTEYAFEAEARRQDDRRTLQGYESREAIHLALRRGLFFHRSRTRSSARAPRLK